MSMMTIVIGASPPDMHPRVFPWTESAQDANHPTPLAHGVVFRGRTLWAAREDPLVVMSVSAQGRPPPSNNPLGLLWRPDGSVRPARDVIALAESGVGRDHPAVVSLRDPRLTSGASGFHVQTTASVNAAPTLGGAMIEIAKSDPSTGAKLAQLSRLWAAPATRERLSIEDPDDDMLSVAAGKSSAAVPSASSSAPHDFPAFPDAVRRIHDEARQMGKRSPTAERLLHALENAAAAKAALTAAEKELDGAVRFLVSEACVQVESPPPAANESMGPVAEAAKRLKRAKLAYKRAAMAEAGWRAHADATRATLEERRASLPLFSASSSAR